MDILAKPCKHPFIVAPDKTEEFKDKKISKEHLDEITKYSKYINDKTKEIEQYVYAAVNSDGIIQQVCGSSQRTYYFRTDKYLKNAVDYHNKCYPDNLWRVAKFKLVEV